MYSLVSDDLQIHAFAFHSFSPFFSTHSQTPQYPRRPATVDEILTALVFPRYFSFDHSILVHDFHEHSFDFLELLLCLDMASLHLLVRLDMVVLRFDIFCVCLSGILSVGRMSVKCVCVCSVCSVCVMCVCVSLSGSLPVGRRCFISSCVSSRHDSPESCHGMCMSIRYSVCGEGILVNVCCERALVCVHARVRVDVYIR